MKCTAFAAVAAVFLTTLPAAFAAETPYLDDRSNPEAVIQSFYNAINRQEYARAWGYFGEVKPAKDFDAFAKGYQDTQSVEVKTGGVGEEGAAGSIYFNVPVAIRATGKDGSEKIFSGCYALRQVNGAIQSPPFNPIHIEKGGLKPSTETTLDDALPESCGDGPQPVKKDSQLEQAKKAFAAAYGEVCNPDGPGGEARGDPDQYTIRYKDADASETDPERAVRLFRFFCFMAAYNESAVYYLSNDVDGVRQLQFAEPELDIRYENGDSEGKVEAVNVTGFKTEDELLNSDYDEKTRTIMSYAKWRGVGDASSSASYLFRNGDFSLVQYDVDASYDGEINPQTVVDYNTPP